jgi:peptide/nickel transport system permease protein
MDMGRALRVSEESSGAVEASAQGKVDGPPAGARTRTGWRTKHDLLWIFCVRLLQGVATIVVVSILVFCVTQALPGNAARAILSTHATGPEVRSLEHQLHLNESLPAQYWLWASGVLRGHPGTSFANGEAVTSVVGPRLLNSLVLVVLAGLIGSLVGVALGTLAALRKGTWFDRVASVVTLTTAGIPDFVIGVFLITLFATDVWHVAPAVSIIPNGGHAWDVPRALTLPVATLTVVIVPYVFRMMRAALIEALDAEYIEFATLKGLTRARVVLRHALPNAMAPVIQAININFIYLAGGVVLVEYIFNFAGIGQGLVNAVSDRDIPVVQFEVLVLAAFDIVINILADLAVLAVTPRRRYQRQAAS